MIKVEPINQIGEDERGRTYTFNMDRTGEFIVGFRKAGSSSGRHYHKGRSPYKCPEKFMIMQGQATVHWRDIKSERLGSEKVTGPAIVYFDPWIWHDIVADSDIVFYELNSLADGRDDTFRLEE
ncbi:MAG TPA: hypothetical protein PKM63_03170 [Panacibacter sp.]|nr:hypothetical protein [Panacibacter sp.]HNP43259.1 hypothetical protein [Panacibacter sp.]